MLYIRFPRTNSSYNWKFVPFDRYLPITPNPQPMTNTILLSISMSLAFSDSTYK